MNISVRVLYVNPGAHEWIRIPQWWFLSQAVFSFSLFLNKRRDLTMLPRLDSNPWAQVILSSWLFFFFFFKNTLGVVRSKYSWSLNNTSLNEAGLFICGFSSTLAGCQTHLYAGPTFHTCRFHRANCGTWVCADLGIHRRLCNQSYINRGTSVYTNSRMSKFILWLLPLTIIEILS